jgi:hypothetical protein
MNNVGTYHIQFEGHLAADEINAMSPLHLTLERIDADAAWVSVCTDQSGLIGLLRHLHARGVVLLSVHREQKTPECLESKTLHQASQT